MSFLPRTQAGPKDSVSSLLETVLSEAVFGLSPSFHRGKLHTLANRKSMGH